MKRMKTMFGLIATACLSAGPLTGCGGSEANLPPVTPVNNPVFDKDAPTDIAVASNNGLGVDLYHQLSRQDEDNGNLFFSPMSVSAALMLTYEGARGETKAEFEDVLSLDGEDPVASHKAYAGVLGRLTAGGKPYELAVANMLWGERTMPFRDAYLDTVRSHYAASFESVDFKTDYETQRKRINGWVSARTKNRVNDLLPEDSLDHLTRLVLVNARYFKATRATEFEEHATANQPFPLQPSGPGGQGGTVKVPMMRQSMEFHAHADMDGYDALRLNYKSNDLSMLILLPDKRDGLKELEKQLDTELIDDAVKSLKPMLVTVTLPKWETTQSCQLKPALKALGMHGAFLGATADFTGLSDSAEAEELYIDDVYHKAFIAVDEAGTEAAASTAVVIKAESAPIGEHVEFKADHPFIYLIRDERTGAILFMGRVTDPS